MTNRRVRKLFYALLSGTLMLSVLFGGAASAESGAETATEQTAPAPQVEAPAPQTEAPAPQTEAPAPQTEASAPQTEAPAPQTEAQEPQTEASAPQTETPPAQTEGAAAETETQAPQTEAPQTETETASSETEKKDETEAPTEETDAQSESETDETEKDTEKKDKDEKEKAFAGSLKVDRQGQGDIYFDDEVTLIVKDVKANKGYTIRWEARENAQAAWKTVQQGKNSYTFKVDEKNAAYEFRAVMVANKTGEELAAPAYHLPEVQKKAEDETEKKADEAKTEEAKTEDTSAQTEEQAQSEQAEEPLSEVQDTLDGDKAAETEAEEAEEKQEGKEAVVVKEKSDDMVDASSEGSQIIHKEVKKAADEEKKETSGDAKLDQVRKLEEEEDLPGEETEGEELIVTTLNRSNVRADADGMSEIFAVAPTDTQFTVLAIEGDWIKVEYEGRIGYIYKTNLDGLEPEEEEVDEAGDPVEKEKKVTIFSSKWTKTYPGETIRLSSILEGFEDCEIYYQWMVDKGNGFEAIEGANGPEYTFTATAENLAWAWKLQVYYR